MSMRPPPITLWATDTRQRAQRCDHDILRDLVRCCMKNGCVASVNEFLWEKIEPEIRRLLYLPATPSVLHCAVNTIAAVMRKFSYELELLVLYGHPRVKYGPGGNLIITFPECRCTKCTARTAIDYLVFMEPSVTEEDYNNNLRRMRMEGGTNGDREEVAAVRERLRHE